MYQNLALGYRFEFDRQSDIVLFKDDNTIFNNIISINIKNNIGVIIHSIKMNEGDCICLLDYITAYLYDFFDWGDECNIILNISSASSNKHPMIHFQNITNKVNPGNINYQNPSLSELRVHELSILESDGCSTVKILTVPMSNSEVEEFVYNLYFVGLMDLTLPQELLEKLDEIIARIFGDNWYNYD